MALIQKLSVPHSWNYSNKWPQLLVHFFKIYHTENFQYDSFGEFQNTLKFLGYLGCLLLSYIFFLYLAKFEELSCRLPNWMCELERRLPKWTSAGSWESELQFLGVVSPRPNKNKNGIFFVVLLL